MEKPNLWEGVLHRTEVLQIPVTIKKKLEDFVSSKIDEALTCKALCSAKIQDAGKYKEKDKKEIHI